MTAIPSPTKVTVPSSPTVATVSSLLVKVNGAVLLEVREGVKVEDASVRVMSGKFIDGGVWTVWQVRPP
jgi:hypothetical protein